MEEIIHVPEEQSETGNLTEYTESVVECFDSVPEVAKPLIGSAGRLLNRIEKMLYSAPAFVGAVKAVIPEEAYQVILTDEQKAKIASGALKLMTKKDGSLMANLINPETKKIVSTVSLGKVKLSPELSQAMTNYATQMQMAQIAEQIQFVQVAVEEVRQGQEYDRLATAYSCQQKLIQASAIQNPRLKEMALMKIILDVLSTTGITATAGIGSNLYLCKVAMDIVAKHIPADKNGVRIAELDEMSYRKTLWSHQPLTDFWRVGKGYAKKLEENGMFTMGDVARRSITDEDLLYKLFGKNAELLIDHAWGWEPCTVEAVKAYKPESNSLGSGQVLHQPYEADKARLVLREMADLLSMDLVDKGFVTNQLVVTIGYDIENLTDPERRRKYRGEVVKDHYGRQIPKHAHGTINLERYTSSTKQIMDAVGELFDRITDKSLLIRRLNITATHVIDEASAPSSKDNYEQLDLFTDYAALDAKRKQEDEELAREKKVQQAMLTIKKKFGKNAILKGMNLSEGATAKDRNEQIGGHKA